MSTILAEVKNAAQRRAMGKVEVAERTSNRRSRIVVWIRFTKYNQQIVSGSKLDCPERSN